MTDRHTLEEFKDLSHTTMFDVIKTRHPELAKGKEGATSKELVDIYRSSLYLELETLANSVSATKDAHDMQIEWDSHNEDDVEIFVQLEAGGEALRFTSYPEAFAALEAKKPLLNIDYGALELRALAQAGVDIGVDGDRNVTSFVVTGADGKQHVFDNPHAAFEALKNAKVSKEELMTLLVGSPTGRTIHEGVMDAIRTTERLRGKTSDVVLIDEANFVDPGPLEIQHVHGPGCGHHHDRVLPTILGTEEMQRLNPDMPTMPLQDGSMLQLSPQEPEYLIKATGTPDGEMSSKQAALWTRFLTVFKRFCENAADSGARREAKATLYSLRCAGVIAHPKYEDTLAAGAKQVRDDRRAFKRGNLDVKDVAPKAKKEAVA